MGVVFFDGVKPRALNGICILALLHGVVACHHHHAVRHLRQVLITELRLEFLNFFLSHCLQIEFVFLSQLAEFIDHLHLFQAKMLSDLVNLVLDDELLLLARVELLQVLVVELLHFELLLQEIFFFLFNPCFLDLSFLEINLFLLLDLLHLDYLQLFNTLGLVVNLRLQLILLLHFFLHLHLLQLRLPLLLLFEQLLPPNLDLQLLFLSFLPQLLINLLLPLLHFVSPLLLKNPLLLSDILEMPLLFYGPLPTNLNLQLLLLLPHLELNLGLLDALVHRFSCHFLLLLSLQVLLQALSLHDLLLRLLCLYYELLL